MKMIGMRRGTGVLVASLALTLATGAGVASADTGLGHRGLYGRHFLADSGEFPAVHCLYDGRNVLEAVTVQPPLVYARDRTADLDRQRVGWRFRVERDDGTLSNWRTVLTSFVTRATGRDDRPAPLAGLDAGVYGRADRNYRVVISMLWYEPGTSTVQGAAHHLVDWYHGAAFEPSFGPAGYCPGGVF